MEQNWLTVKTLLVEAARRIFFDMSININSEGRRRSGCASALTSTKVKTFKKKLRIGCKKLTKLAEIAK